MAPGTHSNGPAGNAQDSTPAGPRVAPAPAAPPAPPQALDNLPPHLGLTREQLDARFALEQRRAEADLAAVEARTIRENEESRARIAAIQAGVVTAAALRNRVDEEEPIGEISPATLLVASRYPGLPKAEIARIFANKFRPENFYKLRHLKGREDKDRDENITIENGLMKLKRVTGTLQDFGSTWDI